MENNTNTSTVNVKHRGRARQFIIYLDKFFRLFILQNDWKVLPMSAIIAGMVALAVGKNLFITMEGTFQGTFALTCVCIWNGFFNSIQSICRERAIIKREHRAGLHITSYVAAHMVYQAFLCAAQCVITILVLYNTNVVKLNESVIANVDMSGIDSMGPLSYILTVLIKPSFTAELFITLFLVTYSADLMALMISAIVHSQMAAMTVMPFMLIIQLVFSGFIALPESVAEISSLMLSKYGVQGLSVISDYNSMPAVMVWNKMYSAGDKVDIGGGVTLKDVMQIVQDQGMQDTVLKKLGEANQRADFASTLSTMTDCWKTLLILSVVFVVVTVVFLEFIDRDKR